MNKETAPPGYFGEWLKYRRKELDLTQSELAERSGCSIFFLRKIEGGERRPSKQLAGLMAKALEIPPENHLTFVRVARGELNIERLQSIGSTPVGVSRPALKPGPPAGNLPELLTPFIGREPELEAVSQLLKNPQCRLLTIIGPGGTGKTRLTVEVAARHKALFPDGAWFIPLAPLSSPELIVPAVAEAMNFRFQDPARPGQQLLDHLGDKKALLVLDNIEHLLAGVNLLIEILKNAPQIKLLVTSRERLNLLSEWVFEIQGLPVPPNDQVEGFEDYSSVALFLQSARRVRASFHLQDCDHQGVARICQIMEGLPLGIELAAAWVGMLSCDEIASEIERNMDFLTISMRDLPERHRSLRATLDYSWNLLSPEEKVILSRLSVFRGTFRREAAEEICGANLAVLSSLRDKSLLGWPVRERYHLHELIHQYSAQKLAEDALEQERLKNTHSLYFAQRLASWEKILKSSKQVEALDEMALEIDDLRQAWRWMVNRDEEESYKNILFGPGLLLSALFSLSLFFELRCRNLEAVSLFEESAERVRMLLLGMDPEEDLQRYETFLGQLAAYLGLHQTYILQYAQANRYMEEALNLLEKSQAKLEKAQAQTMLAWMYQTQGKVQKSVDLLHQNLVVLQEAGERWWYIVNLHLLGWGYLALGKIAEGKSFYQQGLRLADPGDLRLRVPILNGYAYALILEKDYAEAEQLLLTNLELGPRLGNKRRTAIIYLDLGQVALATQRIELAEWYFQQSLDHLSEFGESHDLALGLIHTGKCLVAKQDVGLARSKFLQVIQIGKRLKIFYLVYWGMVNLARTYWLEGQSEKGRQIALALSQYQVEVKLAINDYDSLLDELQIQKPAQPPTEAGDQSEASAIKALLEII
jgi:predicted ATPase/transcriptional regulator with XRE-family HTH domain